MRAQDPASESFPISKRGSECRGNNFGPESMRTRFSKVLHFPSSALAALVLLATCFGCASPSGPTVRWENATIEVISSLSLSLLMADGFCREETHVTALIKSSGVDQGRTITASVRGTGEWRDGHTYEVEIGRQIWRESETIYSIRRKPNKAPEPTITSVTPPAGAGVAPAALVAHL